MSTSTKEPAQINPAAFPNEDAFVAARVEKTEQVAREDYKKFKARERIDNIHAECGFETRKDLIRHLCAVEGIEWPSARAAKAGKVRKSGRSGRRILTQEERDGIVADYNAATGRNKRKTVADKWKIAPGTVYAVVVAASKRTKTAATPTG